MNAKRAGIAVLVAWLASVSTTFAEQVEIVAESALVKVGDDVIATVKRGERFEVLRREGPWLAISLQTSNGDREGWIFASRVRDVVEPGLDQTSTAPGPLELVRMDVRFTQFSQRMPARIFFELSIANQSRKVVHYDASNLLLEVDDERLETATPNGRAPYWIYKGGSMNARAQVAGLNFLGAGEIAPGREVAGWVSFQIPQIKNLRNAMPNRWILSGSFGGRDIRLDLKQCEFDALGAKIRPSTIDKTIPVLEIDSRVNAFNLGKLIEARKALEAARKPYIVVLTEGDCLVGDLASSRLSSVPMKHQVQPSFVNFPRGLRQRLRFYYGRSDARTEPAAAVQILGRRQSTGPQLIKHLTDASPETRAATARALASHLSEPGVVDALLKASGDEKPRVRTTVIQSLASWGASRPASQPHRPVAHAEGPPRSRWTPQILETVLTATKDENADVRSAASAALARSDDPRATQALVRGMADGARKVRISAARAAKSHPAESVTEPLLRMLDDPETQVAVAAATSLGQLKSEQAVPRLKELELGKNKPLAALMLDAPDILAQLARDLKQNQNQYEAQQILEVLGQAGGNQAVAVVAPYLDDAQLCQFAASALLEINSDEAWEAIKRRLRDKDYPHAQRVASRLHQLRTHRSQLRAEIDAEKTERFAALLKDLGDSPHPAVQDLARSHLARLEQRIASAELREFQSLVTAKKLDAAAEVFETAVERRLDAVGDDPAKASRLAAYARTMQQTLGQIDEAKFAERLLDATITAIEAEAKQTGYEELRDVVTDLRGRRLMAKISQDIDVPAEEVAQLLSDMKRQLARKTEAGLTTADLNLSMQIARALDRGDRPKLAADVYRMAREAIRESRDERLARTADRLEGAIRRMALLGNSLELSGTAVEGSPFDWESYRGKVVLVDFWATWCGPCRAEVPNVMKNYRLYHDRGFDVVGISLDRDREALERYLDTVRPPWVTLHDQENEGKHPAAIHDGISAIPTVMLVDREGNVVSLRARGQKLAELLEDLIGSPYVPKGKLTYVDLQPQSNQKLTEAMHRGESGDNNLADLPRGEQTFGGVRFQIGDRLIHLAGKREPERPERIDGIGANARFAKLHILHGMAFGPRSGVKDGTTIGNYVVHYGDETIETIPIVYGADVRDWWNVDRSEPVTRGSVAWVGSNGATARSDSALRLYLTTWDNLHPDQELVSIDFMSTNTTAAAPFCVAMTLEGVGAAADPDRSPAE